MGMRRRIGTEDEPMLLRRLAHPIEHDAGPHRPEPFRRIDLDERLKYFDMSIMTATLQHWPARLVPPPRQVIGAPKRFAVSRDRLRSRPRDRAG